MNTPNTPNTPGMGLSETEFRRLIQALFDQVDHALEKAAIDPDVLESEQSHGSMTLRFADGARCILSAQPAVRQLWMAVASRGIAYHFNYDAQAGQWKDDKGMGIEPLSYLKKLILELTGISLA